ncbi:MAG: IS630 family transposase [Okeania sp. SIO1F9]|nr:IS630 family transposase [Okeania sp. SIO1F9]NET97592.1 IS630 family transposase [Okeania sp. SIO1H2]
MSKDLGFRVTVHMLRRFIKGLGYRWKRFRKSLKKKQNEEEYAKKLAELKGLIDLYKSGSIDLFFADESGFNMVGYVPYGWQPKGEYIKITPSKTQGTQIFGLMSLDNELESYSCTGSMNSQTVIAFIDDFHKRIKQPTVVVLDNAPIHHSKEFEAKVEEWKDNDLYIFYLPKYSPHLNPIEILWRMIKYQWLPYEDIENQKELNQRLDEILTKFGNEYTINFKEQKMSII